MYFSSLVFVVSVGVVVVVVCFVVVVVVFLFLFFFAGGSLQTKYSSDGPSASFFEDLFVGSLDCYYMSKRSHWDTSMLPT